MLLMVRAEAQASATFNFSCILVHLILKLSRAQRLMGMVAYTAQDMGKEQRHRPFRKAWVLAILPPFTSQEAQEVGK